MLATFSYVHVRGKQRRGRGPRETQTALFAARLSAAAELGRQACWSRPRVRRTLSPASGNPPFVLCQHPQKSLLLSRLRPGGDLLRFVQLSRHLSFRQSLAYLEQQSVPLTDPADVLEMFRRALPNGTSRRRL